MMMMSANDNPVTQPATVLSSSPLPHAFTLGISSESLVASIQLELSTSTTPSEDSSAVFEASSFNLDDIVPSKTMFIPTNIGGNSVVPSWNNDVSLL
eukprot:m.10257 g.10257  ORF g.10257 m.10257 type:complete len:97 (-) comp8211_c0_seq1:621-911(-)